MYIIPQLIQEGKVIRTGEDCYALPEPPLPEVEDWVALWLQLVRYSGGSLLELNTWNTLRSTALDLKCVQSEYLNYSDTMGARFIRSTLTDLGRKVLAAQEGK